MSKANEASPATNGSDLERLVSSQFVLTFGKYKGQTVESVAISDPEYLHWCAAKFQWFAKQIKEKLPDVFKRLVFTEKAMPDALDAWAFEGGRKPTFFGVYHSERKASSSLYNATIADDINDDDDMA